MKDKGLYILIDVFDKYEFPLCFGNSIDEVSTYSGFNWNTLQSSYYRGNLISGRYKLLKVSCETSSVDLFNDVKEYKLFCKERGIKENKASSLQEYHNACYIDFD